jgi:hypothetical protein
MLRKRSHRHRSCRKTWIPQAPEHLEVRQVLDSTVVFNEVMYHPAGDAETEPEWIEFYNQLVVDIDISEWRLAGAVEYTFPDKTIVPGRGYVVVAVDPAAFQAAYQTPALGPWTGQLSNAAATIQLYNNDERLMNELSYADGGDWPAGADGTGFSLAKRERQTATEAASNWTTSSHPGGTPGRNNFAEPGEVFRRTLLASPAPVSAHVPGDDSLGTSWILPDFDDSAWLQGTGGVGFDSRPTYDPFMGLDLDAPPNGQTPQPMVNVNSTAYLRIPFEVPAEAASFDRFELKARYDDGFVAYLNGTEILAVNAPGRDGNTDPLTWNASATGSNSDNDAVVFESFAVSGIAELLKPGKNVLAVHALNRSVSDSDALFDFELSGVRDVPVLPEIPLQLNEVAAANAASFFVEIFNAGTAPIDLTGFTLQTTRTGAPNIPLPARSLGPGEYLTVDATQWPTKPEAGDRIWLAASDQRVLDSTRVEDRIRARGNDQVRRWNYTTTSTPGQANVLQLNTAVVINEIMYNPAPELGVPDTLPTYDSEFVVGFTHDQWRYHAAGANLAPDWHTRTYEANTGGWLLGQGLIGFETADLGIPINTEVNRPSTNDPRFVTYYFQTTFELTAADLATVDRVGLSHLVDSGGVFYLNGQEIVRFNMPSGVIESTTVASTSISNGSRVGPVQIPVDALRVGTNVFSAQVHLRTEGSSDVAFGAELTLDREVTPFVPGRPFRGRDEMEWIELYNKSDTAVDLTGWRLSDAAEFEFPVGTRISPQSYLVIAKNAAAFAQIHPHVPVLGNFDGTLSNHDERIQLFDAQDNLADEVHYFEGGTWPAEPDGGGSSLELIDADADNSRGSSWAASDEREKSEWMTFTHRGISDGDVFNRPAMFHEFVFGLLDGGEFLIDDIQVTKNPRGEAIPLMQNGTFESDELGASPAKWRLIGNHSGTVITDPTDASNKVLHVIATGAQAHVHDHAETTFANGERLDDGVEYEIKFRAKWLEGNSQLNNRLWFARLSNTARLHVPLATGTPGAANSQAVENIGPSFAHFQHTPATPLPTEEVTVSVRPEDPDGIQRVTLFWREDRDEWREMPMTDRGDGMFVVQIPAHESGTVVQFYAQAEDSQGAVSMYPAEGPDSRALFQVEDGQGPSSAIERYRLIMLRDDSNALFNQVNRMSNWQLPATLVHENTVYHDISVRQTGSRWIRPNSGYKIQLNQDQPFYGVHDSIRFDLNGMAEIVMKQMLNRAGGSKSSNYDDLGFLISPNRSHSHEVIVQLARYENVYLDEQFADGSSGTKWELDDVTVPSAPSGGAEGLKRDTVVNEGNDIGVNSAIAVQKGLDPEFYRAHLLIKSNRAKDDFQAIVRLAQAIHQQDPDALFEQTNEVMDVDLWMRHYANQAYLGNWDTYGFRRPKNLRIFVRPDDGRFVPLFWDCDLCNFTEPIKTPREATSRLDEIRDIPHNLRLFWGHLLDFMDRSFNEEYVARWASHYGELVANRTHGGDETFQSIAASTAARNTRVRRDMERDIPPVNFEITSGDGGEITVDTPSVILQGKGWVDIRGLRLAGSTESLNVFWPEADTWQVELPLAGGRETFTIEAISYRGAVMASDMVTVNTSVVDPVVASLRITEINYNPAPLTASESAAGFLDKDDFEFIELSNIGSQTISLQNVQFVQSGPDNEGVVFDFAMGDITQLAPGERLVVVENLDAATFRYGANLPVAGQWSGGLNNGSELITLLNHGVVLQQFRYEDSWHPQTDGEGRTLQIINPLHPDLASWGTGASWRASLQDQGTPGRPDDITGDLNGDGVFNSTDLLEALKSGKYEDGIPGNATFAEGDFNGDGDFNSRDLVWVFTYGVYEGAPPVAAGFAVQPHALLRAAVAEMGSTKLRDESDKQLAAIDAALAGPTRSTVLEPLTIDQIFDDLLETKTMVTQSLASHETQLDSIEKASD